MSMLLFFTHMAQQSGVPMPTGENLVPWLFWVIVVAFFGVLWVILKNVMGWGPLITELLHEVKDMKETLRNIKNEAADRSEMQKHQLQMVEIMAILTDEVKRVKERQGG